MPTSRPSGVQTGQRRRARRAVVGLLAIVSLLMASACASADASNVPTAPAKGGTLFVNIQAGLDILDPQRSYSAVEANVLRLMTRTLTTYRSEPGPAASEIVPDLATDTGRPSDGNTVWKFTLKPGVKWEGGEPVTCSQVKYGIERRFSPLLDEGASYPMEYLEDNPTPYRGPWLEGNNGGKGLESIQCLDERNIRFRLKRPVGDFGHTLAMSTFAPVLPEKDTKEKYKERPYSNGPYKIESRDAEKMVLVRNNFWSDSNDQVRMADPVKIVFDFRADAGGIVTNEVIENQGDARNLVMLDGNVAPNFLQQVANDPDLMTRSVTGSTGAISFIAINTQRVPEIKCRQALIYAFNKRKWRAVSGGAMTGDYATTIIPPEVKAHKKFDLYDSLANVEGNPERAAQLIAEQASAGKPCAGKVKTAFPDVPLRRRLMNTVVEAYTAAGIQVVLAPLDPTTYYSTGVGDPAFDYDMMLGGWTPNWANGSAILPPLFASSVIPPLNALTGHAAGNVNWSLLRDPEIDKQMDVALAETSPDRQWALWGDLDQQIQALAVTIPILYEKAFRLMGSNVAGGFIHPAFGMPDLTALGLIDP
jgi:peptide/nickel transport system substrate-binding protein